MKDKIKKLMQMIGAAWVSGRNGKIGVLCMFFAVFGFIRLFVGEVTIQGFVINIWRLRGEVRQLDAEREKLSRIEHHIKLIQNHSPDYIEEVSLEQLNMGAPGVRVLKY